MKKCFVLLTVMVVLFSTVSDGWGWLIYHKPEFRGRVIDAETKKPIEGAVVVVVYYKWRIVGHVGGGNVKSLDARETLTDSRGEFYFPSYNAFTPGSREDVVEFIIFKPGYIHSRGPNLAGHPMREKFFSSDVIGKVGEIRNGLNSWKGILGVVELKRAKTREERLRGKPLPPYDYSSKELPLLIKIINQESKNLGLEGGYK